MKIPNNFECKVVSVEEFKTLVKNALLYNWRDYPMSRITESLIEDGFPKFDITDLSKFMAGLKGMVFLEPVCVDFGDSIFYWLVAGTSAILVKKNE